MKVSKSGYNVTPLTQAQRDELASKVDANTRHIALESGTERAFTGRTVNGMFPAVLHLLHSFCIRETTLLRLRLLRLRLDLALCQKERCTAITGPFCHRMQ